MHRRLLPSRTHPVWQLVRAKPEITRARNNQPPTLAAILQEPNLPRPELPADADIPPIIRSMWNFKLITPEMADKVKKDYERFQQLQEQSNKSEQNLQKELAQPEYKELDWVLYDKYNATYDIAYLRQRTIDRLEGRKEDTRQLQEKQLQQQAKLTLWVEQFLPKIIETTRDTITSSFVSKALLTNDPIEKEKLRAHYKEELTQVLPKSLELLWRWLQIETLDYDFVPELEGVPSLPPRSILKQWYGVSSLSLDDTARKNLLEWYGLLQLDRERLSLHPDPQFHLKREAEWEIYQAKQKGESEEQVMNTSRLRQKWLDLLQAAPAPPDDENTRRSEALAIAFVQEKIGYIPGSFRDLQLALDTINKDKEQFRNYIEDGLDDALNSKLAKWRVQHPNSAIAKFLDFDEDRLEFQYDYYEMTKKALIGWYNQLVDQSEEFMKQAKEYEDMTLQQSLDMCPEFADELKDRVQNGMWDVTVTRQEYERDYAIRRTWPNLKPGSHDHH